MESDTNDPSTLYVRPDGRDAAYYEQFATTPRRRNAWEGLVRNSGFQDDCTLAHAGRADPEVIARKWGLYAFKCWTEPYSAEREPRFLSSWVRMYVRKGTSPRHINLGRGQVALVIDLEEACLDPMSLDAQLATLKDRVTRRQSLRLTRDDALVKPPVRRVVDRHFGACLQVRDLIDARATPEEIKRLVPYLSGIVEKAPLGSHPSIASGSIDRGNANRRFCDMKQRAECLIDFGGYRTLASHSHVLSR